MPLSPTTEGFRAALRRPAFALGEISWRWVMGAIATAVFFFGLFEYLDTLPVSSGELLFLRTRNPYLVSEAFAHIFRGSLGRAALAALLASLLLGMLWSIAASVGRIATVRALLDYFRRDDAINVPATAELETSSGVHPFPALLRLNLLRAAVAAAAAIGFVGASILAGFASPDSNPQPGLAFLLFLPLAAVVFLAWGTLNWLLSLAGMFAVRDGEDAVGAISAAVAFCRDRAGAVFAVSLWTGLAHLVAFVGASVVASMPLGFAAVVPWRLVVLCMLIVTLAYYAVADWLYTARLAGYVCIAEMPEALLTPPPRKPTPPQVTPPQVTPVPPVRTTIDRDEPILSDLPNLAVEM
jgi:hypothetical protein